MTRRIEQRRRATFVSALAFGAALALGAASAAEDVRSIELPDQHGSRDSLAAHEGEVVLVFVVTATGLLNTRFWEEDLRAQVEGITYLRVADVPAGSSATLERIAARLRIVVPKEVPVMIDMEGRWARALGLDTSQPNLLAYTRGGLLGARYRGTWNPDSVPEVAARLRQLKELR